MSAVCRNCASPLSTIFADLGASPLANAYPPLEGNPIDEVFLPLRAWVCSQCLLVQLEEFEPPERIFSDYAYFSSWSTSWMEHSRRYVEQIVSQLGLNGETRVLEIASNDGYLLGNFVERGIPALGVEPAENVAQVAIEKGIDTRVAFFGFALAGDLAAEGRFELVIANNVLAHVPDLHDFVEGLRTVLAPDGVLTVEVPHLLHLIRRTEFDTIYHEHFSYFSLQVLVSVFSRHDLAITDVEELSTHGGSLRLYIKHEGSPSDVVHQVLAAEKNEGLHDITTYESFERKILRNREDLLAALSAWAHEGRSVAGYGAPAKAATLFNYCGIGPDLIAFTVDANPAKQGRRIPGARVPILPPEELTQRQPDVVWLLPWNLQSELAVQLEYVKGWGGSLVVWEKGFQQPT